MEAKQILDYCLSSLNGTVLVESWGEKGIFYNPGLADDGFSGANFQRPGFQSMLADIEAGLVGTMSKNITVFH